MKYKKTKLNAFTLAEVMILLLTLSIMLAAFAPVFTRRYSISSPEDVWTFVAGADQDSAYFDSQVKSHTAAAFIGLTPTSNDTIAADATSTRAMLANDNNTVLWSKIVIGANEKAPRHGDHVLNHIQFRYQNHPVGALYAGRGNMLVGGNYTGISNSSNSGEFNTSFGMKTLSSLTSGNNNTALGYGALHSISTGSNNTAIGSFAGYHTGNNAAGNTLIGTNAGHEAMDYNTAIGNDALRYRNGSRNTAIGNFALSGNSNNNPSGNSNTAIGYNAVSNMIQGTGNTVIGANAMTGLQYGSYNTVIGYNAGNSIIGTSGTPSSYKTCIGSNTCTPISRNNRPDRQGMASLYTDDYERVFIGSLTPGSSGAEAAVLEVHNVPGHTDFSSPLEKVGNSTVVVNGNLIVRGQTYLEIPIFRQYHFWNNGKTGNDNTGPYMTNVHEVQDPNGSSTYQVGRPRLENIPKGLVMHGLNVVMQTSSNANNQAILFAGWDGMKRRGRSWERSHVKGLHMKKLQDKKHAYDDIRENCICASNARDTSYKHLYTGAGEYSSRSYDWVSAYNRMGGGSPHRQGIFPTNFHNWDNNYDYWDNGYDYWSDSYTHASKQFYSSDEFTHGTNVNMHWWTSRYDSYNGDGKDDQHHVWYGLLAETYDTNATTDGMRKVNAPSWYMDKTRPNDTRKSQIVPLQRNSGISAWAWTEDRGRYVNRYPYRQKSTKELLGDMQAHDVPQNTFTTDPRALSYHNRGTDVNYAHIKGFASCCPNLTGYEENHLYPPGTSAPGYGRSEVPCSYGSGSPGCSYTVNNGVSSDARLKNIGDKFTGGLAQIRKLNFYQYTYKDDFNKLPQVGVIAQDLKLVFPTAVTKDKNGYYRIRWDEMFYAAINALKELNTRITTLANNVNGYNKRLTQLKKDNAELNAQLDKLSVEIEKLQSEK